jgi:hypothetical protein
MATFGAGGVYCLLLPSPGGDKKKMRDPRSFQDWNLNSRNPENEITP